MAPGANAAAARVGARRRPGVSGGRRAPRRCARWHADRQEHEAGDMAGPAQDECAAAAQATASSPRHAAAAPALAHAAAGCLAAQRAAGALAVRGGAPDRPVAPGMPCHHQARVVADAAPTPAAPPDTMAAPGRPRRARAAAPPPSRLPRHGCASRPEAGARCGSAAHRALYGGGWVTGIPTATHRRSVVESKQTETK